MRSMLKGNRELNRLVAFVLLLICLAGCSSEVKLEKHLQLAEEYFQNGEFEEARIEYMNAVKLQPTNAMVHARLGIIHFEQGDPRRAAQFLVNAENLGTKDVEARMKLATLYLFGKKQDKVQEIARSVLEQDPENDKAILLLSDSAVEKEDVETVQRFLEELKEKVGDRAAIELALGNLHLKQNELGKAEGAFIAAQQLEPESSAAPLVLGQLYWMQNDLPKADQFMKLAAEQGGMTSITRLQWIEFKIRTGEIEEAKRLLTEILESAPGYLPAKLYLAEIAYLQRDLEVSEAIVQEVLKKEANNYNGLLLKAKVQLAKGNAKSAIETLEGLLDKNPSRPELRYQLALAQLADKNLTQGKVNLSEAISMNPNFGKAVLLLSELELRQGDVNRALPRLLSFADKNPEIPQASLLLAEAFRKSGNRNAARNVYVNLMNKYPEEAQMPLLLARLTLQEGNTNEARNLLQKALELAPDNIEAVSEVVDLETTAGNFQSALQIVRERMEENPQNAFFPFLAGRIFVLMKDSSAAETNFLKAIEVQPQFTSPYLALAQLYAQSGREEDALQILTLGIQQAPENESMRMQRGMIFEGMGEWDKAADDYARATELDPNFGPALNNLAYLHAEYFGDLEKAMQLAKRARELMPNQPHTADTLGWVWFLREDYQTSIRILKEAVEQLPNLAMVHYHLGMANYMSGEGAAAQRSFEKALAREPGFEKAEETKERLTILTLKVESLQGGQLETWKEKLANRKDDPWALVRTAQIHGVVGNRAEQKNAYQAALQISPKMFPALVQLAELELEEGNAQKATDLATRARAVRPDSLEVQEVLGRCAFENKEYKWALSLLEQAVQQGLNTGSANYHLGRAYYANGQIGKARASVSEALRLNSGGSFAPDAQRFLKWTNLNGGQSASQLDPKTQEEMMESAREDYVPCLMLQGVVEERSSNYLEAEKSYKRILEIYPDFAPAAKALARIYVDEMKKLDLANSMAIKARQVLNDDAELTKTLGKIVYLQGNHDWSIRLLEECVQTLQDDAEVFYFLGLGYQKLGEREKSRLAFTKVTSLAPSGSLATEANKMLKELETDSTQ